MLASLRNYLALARSSPFVKHNLIMFAGSMVVAVVNYLYYPVLGRQLSTTSFGEVQALISIFLQVALFLGVLADVSVNIVANEKDQELKNRTVIEIERFATLVMTIIIILAIIFVEPLKNYLHFSSPWPFIVLGGSLILSSSLALRSAYLRGSRAFGKLSISSFITAAAKLLFAASLVALGLGTVGAIAGLLLAQLVSYVYVRVSARKLGLSANGQKERLWRLPDFTLIRPQLPYAGMVLVVSVATTLLFSIDTVLAKHYFDPHTAGLYAGIATTARIIYFVTGSIATVLLSSVHLRGDRKKNRNQLLASIGVTTIIGGAVLLFFSVFPNFTIQLLLGSRYEQLANILPLLSLALFLLSIVNLIFSYDIALRRPMIAVISVIGVIVTTVAMALHHHTPLAIVQSLLLGTITLLGLRMADALRRTLIAKSN